MKETKQEYRGHTIIIRGGRYLTLGRIFKTLAAAKREIDTAMELSGN